MEQMTYTITFVASGNDDKEVTAMNGVLKVFKELNCSKDEQARVVKYFNTRYNKRNKLFS